MKYLRVKLCMGSITANAIISCNKLEVGGFLHALDFILLRILHITLSLGMVVIVATLECYTFSGSNEALLRPLISNES